MADIVKKLYTGFFRTKGVLCALCIAMYCCFTCWAGGTITEPLLLTAAVLFYLLLPGRLFVRVVRLEKSEQGLVWPLAILLGTGFLAVVYCVSMRMGLLVLLRIIPPLLAAAELALFWKEHDAKPSLAKWYTGVTKEQWMLLLLVCTLIFLCGFSNVLHYARPRQAGDVLIEQDFLWMVGNAKSFQLAFPSIEIRFYNVRFAYHYLTEMICGILGIVTGVDCYNILGFYLQPFMLAGLVVCLYQMAMVFYQGTQKKALWFTFSMFIFSCASLWKVVPNGTSAFGNSGITHLLTNITSQTTAILFCSIFCMLFFTAARKGFRVPVLQLGLLICSFVMLIVAKGPVALIAGLSALATIVFMLLQRRAGVKAIALAVAGTAAFALFYKMLFSAATNGSMGFSLTGTLSRFPFAHWAYQLYNIFPVAVVLVWVVQLYFMLPAAFFLYLRGLWQDLRGLLRLAPERLFCNAAAGGGLMAYFLFHHPNYSQVYFFLTAVVFLNLLACDQIEEVSRCWKSGKVRSRIFSAVVCASAVIGFLTAGFLYVHIGGSGIRCFLRDVGIEQKAAYPTVINADDEMAADWMKHHTHGRSTMFATNRIHSDRNHNDGISNVYTAFSGRQAYMEGYAYVADMAPWMWVEERKQVCDRLFDAETDTQALKQLCGQYGITHLIYSTQMTGDEQQLKKTFPCVFSSPTVRIYQTA